MGGCCSLEGSSSDEYGGYPRHIITPVEEPTPRQPQFITTPRQPLFITSPRQPQPRPKPELDEPQFGEFRCKLCGRSWKSFRCWPDKYQMCKHCKKPVFPTNCRKKNPSEFTTDDLKEHERDLCQMCQQLGYSCKNFRRTKRIF